MTIQLPKIYQKEEEFTLYIKYTAQPEKVYQKGSNAITDAKGLYFINPDGLIKSKPKQIWTQGETEASSCWFPTIDIPSENQRISPGSSSEIAIDVTSIGSKISDWTLTWDESNLPSGWTFDVDSASDTNPTLQPNSPHQIIFDVGIPSNALGDANPCKACALSHCLRKCPPQ